MDDLSLDDLLGQLASAQQERPKVCKPRLTNTSHVVHVRIEGALAALSAACNDMCRSSTQRWPLRSMLICDGSTALEWSTPHAQSGQLQLGILELVGMSQAQGAVHSSKVFGELTNNAGKLKGPSCGIAGAAVGAQRGGANRQAAERGAAGTRPAAHAQRARVPHTRTPTRGGSGGCRVCWWPCPRGEQGNPSASLVS